MGQIQYDWQDWEEHANDDPEDDVFGDLTILVDDDEDEETTEL